MRPRYQSLHYDDHGSAFQLPFDSWQEWLAQMRADPRVVWAILVEVSEGRIHDEFHRLNPDKEGPR